MTPVNKQPLFVVTGASGVGKSTTCEELFRNEAGKPYLVMESDILWTDYYDTPEDNYRGLRTTWMYLCANISQCGKPVVLCGCALPEQFENLPERELFTEIHYLAVVCDDAALEDRMKNGRGITDEDWLTGSASFNRWLKEHASGTKPPITLLDITGKTPSEAAAELEQWILARL
ncbi:MAG: AAA family ATPase [Clostridia bacterium]|nr:AAA family ATPase [Clostridia bacterium]